MNKLLQRQLQKYLDSNDPVPEEYLALFNAISDSYDHFEKDRRMLERSIDLSSNEMIDLNKKLSQDLKEKEKAEKLLMKSEANLRAIFDNTDIAYVFLDMDSNIVSYNQTAIQAYKKEMSFELGEGKNLIESIPCDWKRLAQRRHRAVLRGEKISYELSFGKAENNVVWYQVNMLPVYSDSARVLGLIVASEDITDRKTAELEREKMTIDLSQRNKDLEQFAYIVSHNLRSPVANILGLSHLFLTSSVKEPRDQKILMEGVASSVKKLDEVIIDLNSILQIRREINEKKEMVRFSDLVEDIKMSIHSLMEKEKVIIRTDFAEVENFFTLKSYLNSIFFNLISNSIKYRSKDFAPVIEIESKIVKEKVLIKFSDNGLGIDLANNGSKIFGLYKKFHNHVDGKGMGLYMVKTQTEILGGKISVASEVNKGTEFMLEFDLQMM